MRVATRLFHQHAEDSLQSTFGRQTFFSAHQNQGFAKDLDMKVYGTRMLGPVHLKFDSSFGQLAV